MKGDSHSQAKNKLCGAVHKVNVSFKVEKAKMASSVKVWSLLQRANSYILRRLHPHEMCARSSVG
jgi:hypothetical protein